MENDDFYLLHEKNMQILRYVMKRLFSENKMDGDTMRNHAQMLEVVINDAIHISKEEIDKLS